MPRACPPYLPNAVIALLGAAILSGCNVLRLSEPLKIKPGDWRMFAMTEQHVPVVRHALVPPLKLAWDEDIQAGMGYGSPLVVDGIVFVGTQRGELKALSASSGKSIGAINLGESIQGSPIIDGNMVIAALSNTRESLVAFDLLSAKVDWKHAYGDIELSPLLLDKMIYFGNTAGEFYCVRHFTGDQVWKFSLPDNVSRKGIRSSPAIADSMVVFGADDGTVYALDANTGSIRWRAVTGSPVMASPCIVRNTVYIGNLAGTLSCLSLSSGATNWRFATGASIFSTATPADSLIIFGTTGGIMYGLRAVDGSVAWSKPVGGPVNTQALRIDSTLYIGTLKHRLLALRVTDGTELWSTEVSGRVKTSPSAVDQRLYIVTDEKDLLCFVSAQP